MRRLMMLATVVVLMTALLVATAAPALAGKVRFWTFGTDSGTAVPAVVCQVTVEHSPLIGWRDRTCWVFHP
jgi:ABC-type proline/glycine betaine transport system substrate-binding protein